MRQHGSAATEGKEQKLGGITAALGRDRLQRADHLRLRDFVDAVGSVLQRQPKRACDRLRDGGFGETDVETSATDPGRVQVAKHDTSIGESRFGTATPITDRPRIRAGAAWADAKRPGSVDPRNAAPTG